MNKKICFIFPGNLHLCPYISLYLNNLEMDYDIICWDRENANEQLDENIFVFRKQIKFSSKLTKLVSYWYFYRFAKKIILDKKYDGLVFLNTIASLILFPITQMKIYKNKYIVDIRDYSGEKNKIIYKIEKKIIQNSYNTIISSSYFQDFLPPYHYLPVHNIQEVNSNKHEKEISCLRTKSVINIGFIGSVGLYMEQHKKLILKLKNNPFFHLYFIGSGSEPLKEFCELECVDNITIKGKFNPNEILDYYNDIDIIHNLYGNKTPVLDYALSNKLYFAAQLHMPILVCPNTAMEKEATKYGIGITIDLDSDQNIEESIKEFVKNLDEKEFLLGCDKLMYNSKKENDECLRMLKKFEKVM